MISAAEGVGLTLPNVVESCKQEYINRLFNRNPLLHFSAKATKSSDRFCITDLFEDTNEVFINSLNTQGGISSLTSAESLIHSLLNGENTDIHHPSNALVRKLIKQKASAKDLMHMTGQHSLYVGYPLLFIPVAGKAPILAPLFLIPVDIFAQSSLIRIDRVRLKEDTTPITVNPLLKSWCEKYKEISISFDDLVQSLNQNSEIETTNTIEQIFSTIKNITSSWSELEKIDLSPYPEFSIAPSDKSIKKWVEDALKPQLTNSAVLGIVKYSGCALLQDLETLSEFNSDDLGILKVLVTPRSLHVEDLAPASSDSESWHVVPTDPAQNNTINQVRASPWVVIQGPPGTGKSQTIVNLIAQALAKKQTVAVLCEKPAALEVVKKRLAAVGLDELALLIKKPSEQRLEVIKGIKNIKADWEDLYKTQKIDYRNTQALKISDLDNEISQSMQGFYTREKEEGIKRYADVQARLRKLESALDYAPMALQHDKGHQELVQAVCKLSTAQVRDARWFSDEWLNKVKQWEKSATECDFSTSPWREHDTNLAINVTGLRAALTRIQDLYNCSTELHNKRQAHWFDTHNLMRGLYSLSFFDTEHRSGQIALNEALSGLEVLRRTLTKHQHKSAIESIYSRSTMRYLDPIWLNSIGQASNVQQILKDINEFPIGRILLEYYTNTPDQWCLRVEAAAYEYWINCWEHEYPSIYSSVSPLKRKTELLNDLLNEKLNQDAMVLRNDFRVRLKHRDILENNNLLRERTSKHATKTQIRDLLNGGWETTQKLHPVLLTTPEVACQIFPLKAGLFDWVIIDEASQMFTAEALPLIYRGKKIVVAGDNKQMPPSNFFNSSNDSEEDYDGDESEEEDFNPNNKPTFIPALDNPCLLDAAEAVLSKQSHSQKLLTIHYRSSFRELIEYSNHAFYEGELQAPPGNPAAKGILSRPIIFRQLNGAVFHKGVNEQEAQAIVKTVIEILQQPNAPSLGVIVMNAVQKMKIEDLLRDHAEADSDFSSVLEAQRERQDLGEDVGFFVRNVENVQGDERDIIILGATYAGDSRRFGPLGTPEKGRRRLNVAITRAKQGMVVFSSLNSFPDGSGENKSDSWYFLTYLRYAKAVSEGNMDEVDQILDRANPKRIVQRDISLFDSDFEQDVAEFLAMNGYQTTPQARESGFRIDLAVKCSDRLGFLCGIECDGAAFHSSWTARTRDIWRQKILESKGWNIYRIWSTDWFNDTNREKEKLLAHLRNRERELSNIDRKILSI